MKPLFSAFAVAALTLMPGFALAGVDDIAVDGPWSRPSIGTSRPGVAYMTITNSGDEPMTLTGLESKVSGMPQIHRTSTDANGVSKMAPAGDITISAGASVALEPGGLHVMMMKLQRPLKTGESFPLSLIFGNDGTVDVTVPVLGINARGPGN